MKSLLNPRSIPRVVKRRKCGSEFEVQQRCQRMMIKGNEFNSKVAPSDRRGFSLFELMLVMAVVLVLTSITVPRLAQRWKSGELLAAATSVRERLNQARQMAVESGVEHAAVIDPRTKDIRIQIEGNTVQPIHIELPPMRFQDSIRFEVQCDPANRLVGDDDTCTKIRFLPNGTSSAGSISVSDGSSNIRRVSIDRATGSIRIEVPAE